MVGQAAGRKIRKNMIEIIGFKVVNPQWFEWCYIL
jgi:hypothetical protein